MIEPARWKDVKEIVLAALDLPEGERDSYLARACGEDEDLKSAVEGLLAVSTKDANAFDHARVTLPSPGNFHENTVVDEYRVIRFIGEGAMGKVYLAEDFKHDRSVALKVLSSHGMRFSQSERQLLGSLNHPNIATLFDSGTTADGFPYLVMEYVDGEPLADYCEKHAPTHKERLSLFLSICSAVQYAHQHLIVHRDLKPGNILVHADGTPKVVDFGIAKRLPSELLSTSTDLHRPFTLMYASPEQLRRKATATTSDIYSLGVILCVLLTGYLPYRGKDYVDLTSAIASQEPEKPSNLAAAPQLEQETPLLFWVGPKPPRDEVNRLPQILRGDLDAIIRKALSKEPEKRYQSVGELADDIRRFMSNEPVTARAGSRRYHLAKFWERHKRALLFTTVSLLVLVGLSINLLFQYREAARQREQAAHNLHRAEQTTEFLLDIFSRLDPASGQRGATTDDLLQHAAYTLRSRKDLSLVDRLQFTCTLSGVYLSLGRHKEALQLVVPSQRDIEALSSSEPDIAHRCYLYLAESYLSTDKLHIADQLAQRAERLSSISQEKDVSRARALYMRAIIKWEQGAYPQAEALYTQALQLNRRLGTTHQKQIARNLLGLGILLTSMGDYENADKLLQESLSIRQNLEPREHPDIAEAHFSRGMLLHRQGKYAQARTAYSKALSMYQNVYDNNHPRIESILSAIGALYHAEGNLPEAERTLRKAVAMLARTRGSESQSTGNAMNNLAALLRDKGEYREAEAIYKQVLAIDERVLGVHPETARTLTNLGALYRDIGQYEKSLEYHRRALNMLQATVKGDHPQTASALNGLAVAFKFLGRNEEAEASFRESIEMSRRLLGPSHLEVIIAENNLASLLRDQGKLSEARQLLVPAIEKAVQTLGEDHQHVATFRMNLARIHNLEGNYDAAMREIQSARKSLMNSLPADHVLIARADGTLGETLTKLHQFQSAEPYLIRSLSRIEEVEGVSSLNTRLARERLVRLYSSWGKEDKASQYRRLLTSRETNN